MRKLPSETMKVYEHLQDDRSRWLYEKRVMWSLTSDHKYLDNIVDLLIDLNNVNEFINKAKRAEGHLVIRGAGNDYRIIKHLYPELEFQVFVDNDTTKQNSLIDGKQVISPKEFYVFYKDYHVLVNSPFSHVEIVKELKEHGIPEEHIINIGKCYEDICDDQYFERNIMIRSKDEIFVDGGCYDGRTISRFIRWCEGDYKKIYSFEPDSSNYAFVNRRMTANPIAKVELINKGLWNESTELSFTNDGSQGAKISEKGQARIQTTKVDEAVGDDKITFLKLDVEGAEYNALIGARRSITVNKPKLAISIYHKPEDIFEIPNLILSMREDYMFYIRHYQLSPNETILYAV